MIKISRRFHISWLITTASAGILLGTTLSLWLDNFTALHWIIIGLCLLFASVIRKNFLSLIFIFLGGMLIGLWSGGNELKSQFGLEYFIGEIVLAEGKVSEDPSYDAEGDLRFKLIDLIIEKEQYSGELWVGVQDNYDIKRSDIVIVEGKIFKGFGTIPVAMYQADVLNIQRPAFADVARDVRDDFAEGIRESIEEPEASLGAGFLVGQKTALPEKLDNELRLLGLTHIVVASGYNLTILVRFARRGFERISRFTALALSSGLIYSFALVTGFSPSMSRASLITFLSLLAWYYGRKFHPVVLLTFSAAITVLINPSYAWGDIGWLLSFTSFIGVIMFAPLVHAYFWAKNKPGNIRQVLIETFSAQLLTLPIIAFVFGQYSPLAIIANLLVLPFIPLAMVLTFIAGVAGLIVPSFSEIVGLPAETLLKYMTLVVDRLAQLPLAGAEIAFTITTTIVCYIVIVALMIFFWRRTGYKFRNHNVIE